MMMMMMDKSIVSNCNKKFHFSSLTLEQIRQILNDFVVERNWEQFHQPRNILIALIGELGEIAETFQWKSDNDCNDDGLPKWTEQQRLALADELADVLLYLIRFCDCCRLDISKTIISNNNNKPKN